MSNEMNQQPRKRGPMGRMGRGMQPGNEPLHQGHTVEGGHEIEAVGVGQSLPGHLHRHLKAQCLALLPVEAREALDDVLLHMDAVDLVLHEDGVL